MQIILLIGCISFQLKSNAQSGLKSDTVSKLPDSIMQYITPLDYAFMMHEETSWLLKGFISTDPRYDDRLHLKVAFEKRITPVFTLNFSADNSSSDLFLWAPENDVFKLSMDTRWYYSQNKKVNQSKVARSMSDNYISLGLEYIHFYEYYPEHFDYDQNYFSINSKWGLQRRLLKHGIVDIGFKTGIVFGAQNYSTPSFTFNTYIDLGLALTKDKYTLDREKLCPVLRCYESQKYLLKTDFSQLINFSFLQKDIYFEISPKIAFEYKIGSSPFSLNTELGGGFMFYNHKNPSNQKGFTQSILHNEYKNWRIYIELESRWYYNLHRRILKGKSGNGLSASYIAIGGSYKYFKENWVPEGYYYPKAYVVGGWQRLFTKHLYFDIQLGFEQTFQTEYTQGGLDPRIKITLGYRF
ncbi:MAG: hypothetical protein JW731_09890 [Bacteroidales bacterium]|nr:hypothetical protein [Bacteroidales bacterium]